MVDTVFPTMEGSPFPSPPGAASGPARPARPTSTANRLVASHQYLCRRGARKFLRSGLERCDLEQVAAIGLIKASRRYDPMTETPFEAYAWLMVIGELMHHVRDFERLVRVPRRLHDLERRYARAHDALSIRLGREPNDVEIAEHLGIVTAVVSDVRRARESSLVDSLDAADARPIRATDTVTVEDRLLVDAAFAALGKLERRVIAGIYILGLTQLELARRLDVSPKRVSRAHHAALGALQRACAS